MGMERLLPTGKQKIVCDHFFQGEIPWGEFSWMRQKMSEMKGGRESE